MSRLVTCLILYMCQNATAYPLIIGFFLNIFLVSFIQFFICGNQLSVMICYLFMCLSSIFSLNFEYCFFNIAFVVGQASGMSNGHDYSANHEGINIFQMITRKMVQLSVIPYFTFDKLDISKNLLIHIFIDSSAKGENGEGELHTSKEYFLLALQCYQSMLQTTDLLMMGWQFIQLFLCTHVFYILHKNF